MFAFQASAAVLSPGVAVNPDGAPGAVLSPVPPTNVSLSLRRLRSHELVFVSFEYVIVTL